MLTKSLFIGGGDVRFGPYFIEPVIAGIPAPSAIDPDPKPFICNMDT